MVRVAARRRRPRLAVLLLAAALSACTASAEPELTLANADIDELSGLALSHADPSLLWGHNDSGGGPYLYRIGLRGEDYGAVAVPGVQAGDWEDIAAFDDASGPALLIGDVGDNFAVRETSTLYAVRDPGRQGPVKLLWRLRFRYPDGAHDCEAVAVDPADRSILLMTKRDKPPRIYRLPLPDRSPRDDVIADFIGELGPLPDVKVRERVTHPLSSPYYHEPTALDISRDGLTAIVVTPNRAFRYRRAPDQSWASAFRGAGEAIALPRFPQIEAGALSPDGRTLYVGSEGKPAPFARVDLPP